MPLPSKDDLQLLTQVGFLAAGRGDVAAALRIFEALALLRPDRSFAYVGLATALLNAGRAGDAVQRLDTVHLPRGPELDMLEAFKGLALQFAERRGESTYVLRQIVGRARQADASPGALLAAGLLGEALSAASPPEPALVN
ncbi:tetratricopeptide repeat protein [Acidovorax sp. CCYZU-2555]|uniref:tetratricopeptide repeat protein n=1 Tax=Acidovorax sp. CCYZU-2555 TaxID=2835042 RepID=UPI001BCE5692|nr:tetratricopeptide repeat protein [Acidovorax sp. CCYZU-2555]MBS7777592.1 tetratricopeptide repeat protein [Acidovorax sp. CCYZU-2555]